MSEFPKEAFKTLAAALKSGEFSWAAWKAAMVVMTWAAQVGESLFGGATGAPAGTLSLGAAPGVWSDVVAVHHFEALGGDGPQGALDPAVTKAILAFLVQSLLPRLLDRLAR